ncbi:MAG: glycosyl hydrolase family 28-related protein [Acidobacteria bacterium]|nr:glycosyl hydrolase family 28-related protein [Acidobacteriota bacterium]
MSALIRVAAVLWLAAALLAGSHDVRGYGAKGDGISKDTASIQKAIDAAEKQGGGTVVFPAGKYLSGTLHLKSYVSLRLDAGATLLESPDRADFDPYETFSYPTPDDRETTDFHFALLAGEKVEHVSITGDGVIDGNRDRRGGPKPIALRLCRYVAIRGITIRRAPNYAISLLGTDYVEINGVNIVDAWADGIDPDSSRFVRISNVVFDGWDDAIVAKASHALGYRRSTENLTVSNCILTTNSCYLKFGSESGGDFRNVTMTGCVLERRRNGDPRNLAAVSLESMDGSTIDGVVISNIVARDVYMPFALKIGNRGRGPSAEPGTIRNVTIAGFISTGASVAARITGLENHPVENVNLHGLSVTFRQPRETAQELEQFPGTTFRPQPAYGLVIRHAANITLSNVALRQEQPDGRPALLTEDVRGLVSDVH